MKKLLSLLLICTMILSLVTISIVSADGEGYKISNGTISSSNKRFTLNIATITAAQSGYVTIKYDPTKVTLLKRVDTDTGEVDEDDNPIIETTYQNAVSSDVDFVYAQSSCSYSAQKVDVAKGQLVIEWFNTSGIAANKNVARLYFIAIDGTGDNFTESTFTTVTAAADLAALEVSYPAYVGTSEGDNDLGADAYTWSYKNADVADENGEEVFEITKTATSLEGTDTMKDANGADVAAAGEKVVAIFAKNVSDTELAAGSYGIIFGGVRYPGQKAVPGKTAWAVKLVGPADKLPAGNYAYGIFAAGQTDVEAGTYTVQ